MPIAAFLPILVILALFVVYCLYDIWHQQRTRHLPKPAWVVITLISVPLGGILYLLLGRSLRASGLGRDA